MPERSVDVVVVGAGGHGREVANLMEAQPCGWRGADRDRFRASLVGFVDDVEPERDLLQRTGAPWLGPLTRLRELDSDFHYVIGVGGGALRRSLDKVISESGLTPVTLVHPTAVVGRDVILGSGTVVFALATVTTNIRIGRHVHIGRGVAVGHDTCAADYVSVFPNAAISGNVRLGEATTVGSGAVIKQGVELAPRSVVGAGAAVVSDVSGVVVGVPARPMSGSDD